MGTERECSEGLSDRDEKPPNVLLDVLIIASSVAFFSVLPWEASQVRTHPAAGDDNTIRGAVAFGYAATVFALAARYPSKSYIFAILTLRQGVAPSMAFVFGSAAIWLLLVWLGLA